MNNETIYSAIYDIAKSYGADSRLLASLTPSLHEEDGLYLNGVESKFDYSNFDLLEEFVYQVIDEAMARREVYEAVGI